MWGCLGSLTAAMYQVARFDSFRRATTVVSLSSEDKTVCFRHLMSVFPDRISYTFPCQHPASVNRRGGVDGSSLDQLSQGSLQFSCQTSPLCLDQRSEWAPLPSLKAKRGLNSYNRTLYRIWTPIDPQSCSAAQRLPSWSMLRSSLRVGNFSRN